MFCALCIVLSYLRPKWHPRAIPKIAVACAYLPLSIAPDDLDKFYDYFQSCSL